MTAKRSMLSEIFSKTFSNRWLRQKERRPMKATFMFGKRVLVLKLRGQTPITSGVCLSINSSSIQRISNGFPLDSFFFFLFCYKNPYLRNGSSKRITSLSQFDDEMEVRNFIVTNIDMLYVIDIALIQHLFSICRVSDKSIPLHRGVKSLNVRPRHMRLLADGGWKSAAVRIRNLEQKSFSSEFVFAPYLWESHKVKLNIAMIGRAKETQKLIRCFKPGILT